MGHYYITDKNEDRFSTTKNGTVPKPSASDVLNGYFLAASGLWLPASGGGGGTSYSLTEQVIGTYVDGKTLYQKTFYFASLPQSGENIFLVDIVVEKVAKISGICLWNEYAFHIPFASWDNGLTVELVYNTLTNDIRIHPKNSNFYRDSTDYYITVQYTKPTV